jgi:uncharacterized membrane protein YdfJ with MMPL/SSD domain
MIGLNVDIDYATLSTARFRQQVSDGLDPVRAAANTTSTSGCAIVVATSVAIDDTLIRLLLVPATMYLFGERNWCLPGPLGRLLPHVSID